MSKDFILNSTGDLEITQGDFAVMESGQQNVGIILSSRPGEHKQHPWLGADYLKYLNDDGNTNEFISRLQKQLDLDGASIESIRMNQGELIVKGSYA